MGSAERKQQFLDLIEKLNRPSIKLNQPEGESSRPLEQFFITYMGSCFVEGYRVQEKIGKNLILLSQMNFQGSWDYNMPGTRKLNGSYRILCIEFKEDINEDREERLERFESIQRLISDLKEMGEGFEIIPSCLEIHFIFVSNFKYAIADVNDLKKGTTLDIKNFYERDYGFPKTKGYRILSDWQEGTKLHFLVELFLKGSGILRNLKTAKSDIFQHTKFKYSPQKVINTICYIVGKEVLQNNYHTLTAEKWMRKSTVKKFKRFDLLLRNDDKVCIIDWKFSKIDAEYKMTTKKIAERNKVYFQLARKQFNSTVELKFYCFHQKLDGMNHHKYTVASFTYNIESVDISDSEIQISDSDSQGFYMKQEIKNKQIKQTKKRAKRRNQKNMQILHRKPRKNIGERLKEKEDASLYTNVKNVTVKISLLPNPQSINLQFCSKTLHKAKKSSNTIQISSDLQVLEQKFESKQKEVIQLD